MRFNLMEERILNHSGVKQENSENRIQNSEGVLLTMSTTSKFQLSSTKSQTNPKFEIQNRKQGSALKHQLMNR
jgi:hypothetical protein